MIHALLGLVFGIAGGMGLGGGIVLIPALTLLMGVEQHTAQGMALFAYLPMGAFALASHVRKKAVRLIPSLFIAAFGLLGSVAGYFLAAGSETRMLRTAFGIFLVAAALLRAWRQEIGPWLKKRRKNKEGN